MNHFDEFIRLFPDSWKEKDMSPEALNYWIQHIVQINVDFLKSDYLKDKKRKKEKPSEYKYMITFTLDPKKVDLTSSEQKNTIERYIVNLLKCTDNFRFYYVREHEFTNTHWHAIVHRKIPFTQDKLAYYKRKFGNVQVNRSKELDDEFSLKYLGKENEIIYIKQ